MATLIRPPPADPTKSVIENTLELMQLSDIDPDIFTNTRKLWHPPGARGLYGGAVIAQCLAAAQRTVPETYSVHSMHCYFVLAGSSDIPVVYHVEHVREGKSFATRTVQARQRGRVIFTTTLSFMRDGSGGERTLEHITPIPNPPGPDEGDHGDDNGRGPWIARRMRLNHLDGEPKSSKFTRQWMRARGQISPAGGHQAHLEALAYMSDSFFIGTVARVHQVFRDAVPPARMTGDDSDDMANAQRALVHEATGGGDAEPQQKIGMMVSLDHTIFFHRPRDFKADDWLFCEMQSPWAGDGRGLVIQKIWDKHGHLIATAVQEGLVRLVQDSKSKI